MTAAVQRLKRFENIRARLELVVPGFEAKGRLARERGRRHGTRNRRVGTMPLLALHRKDSDRAIPSARPKLTKRAPDAATMALSWPRRVAAAGSSRERAL